MLHDITDDDIKKVSDKAKIVEGAKYLFEKLPAENWDIYIISTSYEQHACNIYRKLGIEPENIVCTGLSLKRRKGELQEKDFSLIKNAEGKIIELHSYIDIDDASKTKEMVNHLDKFFFDELPLRGYDVFRTRVIGGERKAEAMRRIAREKGEELKDTIAVGDSITDYKMLKEVTTRNGISVVFNGNEYAVPYASVGLASEDIRFLHILCESFIRDGKKEAMEMVSKWDKNRDEFEKSPESIPKSCVNADILDFLMVQKEKKKRGERVMPFPYFHNIEKADERRKEEIIKIHKKFRMRVREEAGKLG